MLHLTKEGFEKRLIPLPPLEIQEQIVKEIEGYQKIIDGAKMVVENYKPTISIKPEWKMVELGEVCKPEYGYTETDFADDLNCWKAFSMVPSRGTMHGPLPAHGPMLADMRKVQHELHLRGRANQALFDRSKESFHILHRTMHFGENFKILGCVFDP